MNNQLSCKKRKYQSYFAVILNTIIEIIQANHTLQGHFRSLSPFHIQKYFGNSASSYLPFSLSLFSLSFFLHSHINTMVKPNIEKRKFQSLFNMLTADCLDTKGVITSLILSLMDMKVRNSQGNTNTLTFQMIIKRNIALLIFNFQSGFFRLLDCLVQ